MADFCHLWLTCEDKAEADKVAKVLLDKHLIACAKQLTNTADYLWEGKTEHAEEILLVMDSKLEYFDAVEAEVAKIHSYETFNLQAVAVAKVSKAAEEWLNKELKHG